MSNQLRQGSVPEKWVKIVERLLQIKDFQSFEHLLPIYINLVEAGSVSVTLSSSIIHAVQSNCLPLKSSN
jgi:predicted HTH domain antitoxin